MGKTYIADSFKTTEGIDLVTEALMKGGYVGTAESLKNLIVSSVTGVTGISITPADAPTGTGIASWVALQAGTYTNFGGVVVTANSMAIISRSDTGTFSISQSPFDLTNYLNKTVDIEIYQDNIFDKTQAYAETGAGIGSNGVPYNLVGHGRVWKLPVKELSSLVITGCPTLRGLLYQDAAGLTISFVGSPINGTAYTTPAGTKFISFQVYAASNGFDTVKVQYGTVATTYTPYRTGVVKSIAGVEVRHYNEELYTKSEVDGITTAIATKAETNRVRIDAISTRKEFAGQIIPSSTYNYQPFNVLEGEIKSWYIGKSVKTIKAIGVFVYRNTSDGIFTNDVKVQVVHKRGSVNTIIMARNITPSQLINNTTSGIVGGYANYEIKLEFENNLTLAVNDQIFVSIQSNDKMIPIYGNVDTLLPSGEWNDGSFCYRSWAITNPNITYSTVPALPTTNPNYNVLHFYSVTTDNIDIGSELDTLNAIVGTEPISLDDKLILPKNVYAIQNTINGDFSTNYNTNLWVQKFIRDKKELYLNSKNNLNLNKYINVGNVDIDNISIAITGTGYIDKTVVIPRVSVKSTVLASAFPKVMYIGDSITSNRYRNGDTTTVGSIWNMPKEISLKNKIDNGNSGYNYLNIGREIKVNSTITYKSSTVPLVGYAQGKGGWTAFGYLRHPFRFWVYSNKQGAWDILGLTTALGRNYNGSDADNKTIATTNYGVNTPLITVESYNLMVFEGVIANLGTWTASSPQIEACQSYIDGIADGSKVTNEFFDYSKTGTNRFSISKYLERYKTLNDDGVTRLTVGSTAGSKVTDATTTDVCTPTNITICLGENDRLFYQDFVQISNDIIEFSTAIHSEYPNIHVGVALTGIPGDMFPERNPDYVGLFYQSHHNTKTDLYKELTSRFGDVATQKTNKTYLIPTWHTGTPLSNSLTKEVVSEDEPNKIIQVGNDDYNHPGYYHNRSAGIQVYGWVAYTFS